ncbi:LysR family transcriptional regulator [Shinella sp. HZN7]|uniref:LysR family transcriptional regulator n=1 Tax=Shinella sp. (strain HZN7) TaxID=879274 RepID=UPI000A016B66|nr:LysR family transcriptional regulator [Shinella sp. HZN7]
MELGSLRIFMRAAELGSFSKAAVSLGIAQPSVSRTIGDLEREWGSPLFYRTGRGVALSELGEEALKKARFLLREADQAAEDLKAFSRLPSGIVSLGLPTSLVEPTIPELVNQLRAHAPGIRLQVYEGFSDQVERWLSEGLIDIGAYSKYREGEREHGSVLLESRLVLAGPREGWTLPEEIAFERLADFALVLPAPTNGLRIMVDSVARRLKVSLNVIADIDSTGGQKAMAARCGCYMVKAPHTISEETSRGLFASSVIRSPYINRHVVLVTGQQRPLSRASREVVARLTGIIRELSVPKETTGQSSGRAADNDRS